MGSSRPLPGSGKLTTALVVAVVVYILSPIPLAIIALKLEIYQLKGVREFYEAFYMPLMWLDDHVPAVKAFYRWYGGLFAHFMP